MPSTQRLPRTGPQYREAVEGRLLAAVEELLTSGWSYRDLPVQKIADAADIGRSTFYGHFDDKFQLILRLAQRVEGELYPGAWEWWLGDQSSGPRGLAQSIERAMSQFRRHLPVVQAVLEASVSDPVTGQGYRDRMAATAAMLAERLEQLNSEGKLSPDLDIPRTAEILVAMAERVVMAHVTHGDKKHDTQVARALARAVWLTIYGDADR